MSEEERVTQWEADSRKGEKEAGIKREIDEEKNRETKRKEREAKRGGTERDEGGEGKRREISGGTLADSTRESEMCRGMQKDKQREERGK